MSDRMAYRLERPQSRDAALRGLCCLMGGPEPAGGAAPEAPVAERVEEFLGYADSMGIDVRRQVVAVRADGSVAGTCLWVPAPGRTAMLFGPALLQYPEAGAALGLCAGAAVEDARQAGVVLLQVMLEPEDHRGAAVFSGAGLEPLAGLLYMERRPPLFAPAVQWPAGLRQESYRAETHGLFRAAIVASYEATLDCPRLSGLRDVEDVIAGHKAMGHFDPELWTVVLEQDRPLGVLLLAEIPARRAIDVVYLGLAVAGRGRGLGRALMQQTLGVACRRRAALVSLAVDESNAPALKLYRRFGLSVVARRKAMVKKVG